MKNVLMYVANLTRLILAAPSACCSGISGS